MARPKIKLDHDGIAEMLKSADVREEIYGFAAHISDIVAPRVDAIDGVVVDEYTTDRAAASVTIRDPRGLLWQSRDGLLTSAAASVGLEVKTGRSGK